MIAEKLDLDRHYSVEEYLAIEEKAELRHEYWNGRIVPLGELVSMAGGAAEHSTIKLNLYVAAGSRLRGQRCQAFDSEMQVFIPGMGSYVYPDMSVVCTEPEFVNEKRRQLLNPDIVVEVLSPGTEAYDRKEKFDKYLRLESMNEYVLVSTDAYRVESYLRQGDGTWSFAFYVGLNATFRFRSIGLDVPMLEIYERIALSGAAIPA